MNYLLYEVRKDALKKMTEVQPDKALYALMLKLVELGKIAYREGPFAVEDAVKDLPQDNGAYETLAKAVTLMADATAPQDVMEMLTASYWAGQEDGQQALMHYFVIVAVLRLQEGTATDLLEQILLSHLPGKAQGAYRDYRNRHTTKNEEHTPLQEMLMHEETFEEGGLLTVRRILESRVMDATEESLLWVLRQLDEKDIEVVLKGLSIAAKRRLLSVVAESKADRYAEGCMYMGPVRAIDILQAFAEMLALFEKTEEGV